MIPELSVIGQYRQFTVYTLTKALATKCEDQISKIFNLIPLSTPQTTQELLSDFQGKLKTHSKWKHSLIALDKNQNVAGVIIASEREKEDNDLYPENSIYINSFGVRLDLQKQGLGKFILQTWLEYNRSEGFLELIGKLKFTVQTNSGVWNVHVQKLYESVGFKKVATKVYDNRIDNVFLLDLNI